MKILEVCPYDMTQPGGVQAHILDLAEAMRERGHEVTVLAPGGDHEQPHGVVTFGNRRRFHLNQTAFDLSLAWGDELQRLKDYLHQQQFDLIHFHTLWTPLLPLQVMRLTHNCAHVATFHDTPPETLSGRMTRQLFRFLSRVLIPRLDGVIVVSESPARHLARLPGKPIHLLPPCTDYSRFSPDSAPFEQYRDERINLLFFGRLEPRKGVMVMLEAYRKLQQAGQPVRLLLAGDGEQRSEVERFIAEHQLGHVELLGRISEADKPRWYTTADIFCAPSLYGESFGIVLVEAMASGLPVVAAANSGYRTVLESRKEHCLVPPGDSDALQQAISRLIESPQLRTELGHWGVEAARHYTCRERAEAFESIFNQAVCRHSG